MKKLLLLLLALPWGLSAMEPEEYTNKLKELHRALSEEELTIQAVEDFFKDHGTTTNELNQLNTMTQRTQRVIFAQADKLINNPDQCTIASVENSFAGLNFILNATTILKSPDRDQIYELINERIHPIRDIAAIKQKEQDNARKEEERKASTSISSLLSTIFSIKALAIISAGYLLYRYSKRSTREHTA